ncbi:MAG: polysulfide reductase NrfD, partial [Gammaproteobacteria bacterium]|nr:polysulfide reductase NrfD [Gammaproteobacteria bacterium]
MTTNTKKEKASFIRDCIGWALSGGIWFKLYLVVLLAFMGAGVFAYAQQFQEGLIVTGMSNIVSWGLYIANFTFFVGVAAAAVMLILPAYILKNRDMHEVVIIGECVAVGALIVCMLFIFVDLGNPMKVWHMMPGIG